MFDKITIIGCGLIGSSLLRVIDKKKLSKKILPDLIHAHYASSYGLLGVKAKTTLLITSVWGTDITDFPYKSIFHKHIIKYVLKKSDHIFVTSNFLSKEVKMISGHDSFITPFGVERCKKNYHKKKFFNLRRYKWKK